MAEKPCGYCNGKGTIWTPFAMKSDGSGCSPMTFPCPSCKGDGIEKRQPDWEEKGRELRRRRVDVEPYESLREAARRLGIGIVELSEMERGLREPIDADLMGRGNG